MATKRLTPITALLITFVPILIIMISVLYFTGNKSNDNNDESEKIEQPEKINKNGNNDFPFFGEGCASIDKPIEAYLDPLHSYTRILGGGEAKFVLASNPSISWICNQKPETNSPHMKEWWGMPRGNYLIYPHDQDKICFRWWQ